MSVEQKPPIFDPEFELPMSDRYRLDPNQEVYAICGTEKMDRVSGIYVDLNNVHFSPEDETAHELANILSDIAICNGGFHLARVVRARHPVYGYPIEGFAVIATR